MSYYLTEIDISRYSSSTQIARLKTEAWVAEAMFCPSCGNKLKSESNNKKACDFTCLCCIEEFELKSKNGKIGPKIVNGAYFTLTNRLESDTNPNLFVLQYRKSDWGVENFFVIPKYFFTPNIIEKRKPLSLSARRAGWIGCNILIGLVPDAGRIHYVKNNQIINYKDVIENWNSTRFLAEQKAGTSKNWLLDVMSCIDHIGKSNFSLEELYSYEKYLSERHPDNSHIKEKIRQKVQILRDNGYLTFMSRGHYKRCLNNSARKSI
ncbi:DpnI domain-containing protein [Asticcacaulis sp.]|uniref:DpnI domain-containing protein n=1 Tax=Asticcacaulis sp. TaxID=1872648 RepID=UPI003F7B7FD9